MGTDNTFHKLKAKANRSKKRAHEKKEPYPKFLIVCEDTVSGYHYLIEAVRHFRLSTANFSIVGLGQDPLDIVLDAERRFNEEKKSHKPDFERVFCVFDKDNHARYYNAISKIDSINKLIGYDTPIFTAITSIPCFEIWLILHFEYTTKLYTDKERKTASNQVAKDLTGFLKNYDKSNKTALKDTIQLLPSAITNAQRLCTYCEKNSSESPATKMHELMTFISTLK